MSRVIDNYTFAEFREHPSGIERYGIMDPADINGIGFVSLYTVAYRTDKKKPWLAASAGSVTLVSTATKESYALVEDPLG